MASHRASARRSGSTERVILPDSIRAMSNTSLIKSRRCFPPLRICCTLSCCSGSRLSNSRSWLNPRMALRGVRNSWLIRERNSLLALFARWASSLARPAASSASRRSVTCRSRSRLTRSSVSLASWNPRCAISKGPRLSDRISAEARAQRRHSAGVRATDSTIARASW